eukprot:jgi/Pico_ML_1/52972/g3600.t1
MERDAKELGDRRDVVWKPQDGRAKPIQSVSKYDLVLVVDKYALEDVMRDAAVDDLARKAERGGTLLSTREMVDREEHQTKEQCQKAIQEYLENLANDRPVEWMKPPMLQDKA